MVVPESVVVQRVPDKEWSRYRELLSGITDENVQEVRLELMKLGSLPASSGDDGAERPPKRPRAEETSETAT